MWFPFGTVYWFISAKLCQFASVDWCDVECPLKLFHLEFSSQTAPIPYLMSSQMHPTSRTAPLKCIRLCCSQVKIYHFFAELHVQWHMNSQFKWVTKNTQLAETLVLPARTVNWDHRCHVLSWWSTSINNISNMNNHPPSISIQHLKPLASFTLPTLDSRSFMNHRGHCDLTLRIPGPLDPIGSGAKVAMEQPLVRNSKKFCSL